MERTSGVMAEEGWRERRQEKSWKVGDQEGIKKRRKKEEGKE